MHNIKSSDRIADDSPATGAETIRCQYCDATHNSRGRPFDAESLNQHYRKKHPEHFEESKPDGALTCDLCGKWRSKNGPPFVNEADLSRHRAFCLARNRNQKSPGKTVVGDGGELMTRPSSSTRNRRYSAAMTGEEPMISFCPQCGCNLRVVQAAISFVGKQ